MEDIDRFPLGAVYALLALLGAALGVWGAFLIPVRLPGGIEGLADVIAFGGNLVVAVLAARGSRNIQAAAMPGLGWLVVVLVLLTVARPSDEVVIPGGIGGDPGIGVVATLFLFAGAAGAVVGVVIAGRRRPG
ncbi:MAG: hypothetical protein QOF18_1366 [Frankiaceae bacterium]|nr:hypothetical protein [Frankiaceae bacterium]